MVKKYIVKLEKDVYIAKWEGDPGRTLKLDSAKKYNNNKNAIKGLKQARKYRPFINAEICEIDM